jgi:putative phage-type endonuclease
MSFHGRSFTIIAAPQRSPEWFAARLGRLTGSCAAEMLAKSTTATYQNLRTRLVVERLTNTPQEDGYTNEAMQWGNDHEDEARIAYEMATGFNVQESGFLAHDALMAGCSLDGHVGDFEGIIEMKCPFKTARHIATVRGGVPTDYAAQITHNLWISGAAWCDYISYDPRLPDGLRLVVHRVQASGLKLDEYAKLAETFLKAVDLELAALRTMANPSAVLAEVV